MSKVKMSTCSASMRPDGHNTSTKTLWVNAMQSRKDVVSINRQMDKNKGIVL
jgi:hypothetical protein